MHTYIHTYVHTYIHTVKQSLTFVEDRLLNAWPTTAVGGGGAKEENRVLRVWTGFQGQV